jgi:ParB family chromosome partitioning protein
VELSVSEPSPPPNSNHRNGMVDLGQIVDLPVTALVPASDNPRRGRGKLADLAASIASVGVLQPLLVTAVDDDDRYRIVCGERRWAAAVRAGLESVPCIVCVLTEIQRHEAMLIENLQRSNLSKMDEAQAYARLMDLGLSQRDIASRVGRSQAHISRRMRLLTLPVETRTLVDDGELPLEHALGYRSGPPTDLYGADEQLQRAWMALRAGVIESGDHHLIRLLRQFAAAHSALFQMART